MKTLNYISWWKAIFDFETRINVHHNPGKPLGGSSKGNFMKISNTFLYTFTFALRQFFLVFLTIYMFAALAEWLFGWMPCTVCIDFQTVPQEGESREDSLVRFGELYYGARGDMACEYADPGLGSLDINLVFSQFSSVVIMLFWCFVSRDPQEPFTYLISKANEEEYRERASKKAIFVFFLVYFCFMITFQYIIN